MFKRFLNIQNSDYRIKFLVHLHIYYHNQVDYFIKKLSNIRGCDWDLFVTYVEENQDSLNKIKKFKQDTILKKVENIGYDVWPFIQVIKQINLKEYDYVIKLHTKNCSSKPDIFHKKGYYWRNHLVNPLIGSKKIFKRNLKAIAENNNIGIVTGTKVYIEMLHTLPEETYLLYGFCKKYNININQNKFIAGTMFIIKSNILEFFKNSDINKEDFDICSKSHSKGSIAHVLERIFSLITTMYGYNVYYVNDKDLKKKKIESFLQNLFTLTNSFDKCYKVIKIFNKTFFIPKKYKKFKRENVEYNAIITPVSKISYNHKRAVVFALSHEYEKITNYDFNYLKELKNHSDFIIVVSDFPMPMKDIELLKQYSDAMIINYHNNSDIGSYSIGYLKLKELGILNKVEHLLFVKNSVVLNDNVKLKEILEKGNINKFYGATKSQNFNSLKENNRNDKYIQKWFIQLSNEIFNSDWFYEYMTNYHFPISENNIFINVETDLSQLIINHGYEATSYYPFLEDYYAEADTYYANPNNDFEDRLFTKKRFLQC